MSEHREPLPPRIPRGEAVTPRMIERRLYDIEQEHARVQEDIAANMREYDQLLVQNHHLVSEHDRLRRKLDHYRQED